MGLVDAILGHVSLASVALFVVSALVVRHVVQRVDEHQRITRLGGYAPSIKPCWAPLGIDFIVRGFRAQLRDQTYDFWRNGFFARADAWTVETRVVGQRALFTADPDNIKAMLSTQFGDFGKGQPFHDEWEAFLGDGIFATDGALWQASRQLIRPQFTRDRVSDLDCFESHVQTLFAVMAKAEAAPAGQTATRHKPPASVPSSSRGRVVEMTDLFYRFTLDVTTDFLLGADVKSLTSSEQGFANAWDEVQLLQCLINRTFAFGRLLPMPRFHACLGVVNNFVNTFIDRVLGLAPDELAAKDEGGYTFLHALAGFSRDRKVMRDQIVNVLLAGRDTTASALSWAVYELARRPAAAARLRAEVLASVGAARAPTSADLKAMPYLRAVVDETLRLYPPVPFNCRLALADTTLPRGGGPDGSRPVAVLKDTPVSYSPLVMQRRPDLYPPASAALADPATWSPERWAGWSPRAHEYIPFNAGPRVCVGQQFGITEVSYVLCRLFQRFARVESHMEPIDGGDPVLKCDVTLSPGRGVYVSFHEQE